jgi:cell division initiation protein
MLTPQEVADKTFKQAFVGGYDMPAVDEFLERLTEDYTILYKENAVLKNKMKVLVEKLEEYRGNEDSLRQAYLAIRSQADKELEEARAERERILEEARRQAREQTGNIEDLVAREERRLSVTREQTASFVNILKECYGRQMEQLDIILTASMEDSPKKKHDDAVRAAAEEINASLTASINGAMSVAAPEPEPDFPRPDPPEPDLPGPERPEPDTPPGPDFPRPDFFREDSPESEAAEQNPTIILPNPETFADETDGQAEDSRDAAPDADEEPAVPPIDEDLVYSIQQSLTATFNEEVDWTPEEISEVRRPSFDFSSLPGNFGHRKQDQRQGKRSKK